MSLVCAVGLVPFSLPIACSDLAPFEPLGAGGGVGGTALDAGADSPSDTPTDGASGGSTGGSSAGGAGGAGGTGGSPAGGAGGSPAGGGGGSSDAGSDAQSPCPDAVLTAHVNGYPGTLVRNEGLPGQDTLLTVVPLTTLIFDGSESSAVTGNISSYDWSLTAQPLGSTDQLIEEAGGERARLFTSLAGTYRVELQVRDDQAVLSCDTAAIEIQALAHHALHIQLVWVTPADANELDTDGSDLDVHLRNTSGGGVWNTLPGDCYSVNAFPDWGVPLYSEDNPSIDRDDTDGGGPENINIAVPELDHVYSAGVHYYDDHGFGSAFATVRIYAHGVLVLELPARELTGSGQFWHVADIHWTAQGTAAITSIDQITTGFP